MRNLTTWFSICILLICLVLFIIPSSSGEVGVSGEKILGNESWSLILLGASMIGFALMGLRKTGK